MKFIIKKPAPNSLVQWIAINKGRPNLEFKYLPGDVKAEIKNALLDEQGYLCAYTGLRISDEHCHIEHLLSQKSCRDAGLLSETVAYDNIVACFPGTGDPEPGFGARYKADWPSQAELPFFLKPTDPTCEQRIEYLNNGKVSAKNPTDLVATSTLEKLNLGHPKLEALRREALLGLWDIKSQKPDRAYIAKRLARVDQKVAGEFEEFCFVKRQYLQRKIKQYQT